MEPAYASGRVRAIARPVRLGLVAVTALAGAVAIARADDTPPSIATLTGALALGRIVGHTISGTTPDGTYTESFAADGSLVVIDRDGRAGGHWVLRDDKLCTQVDDEDEECRMVALAGTAGTLTDEAGNRYAFDLLPDGAKGP